MSDTANSTLARVFGRLALALVNATLLLVVLALFLVWRVSGTVERVTETALAAASAQLVQLAPIREELFDLRQQISGLRTEMSGLRSGGETLAAEEKASALMRLEAIEARMSEADTRLGPLVEGLSTDPGVLVDQAVATGMAELGIWLASLRGCNLPEQS